MYYVLLFLFLHVQLRFLKDAADDFSALLLDKMNFSSQNKWFAELLTEEKAHKMPKQPGE